MPDPAASASKAASTLSREALVARLRAGSRCSWVLDALTPPERLAFVLHDLFGVPLAGHRGGPPPFRSRCAAARQPRARDARPRLAHAGPGHRLDMLEVADAFFAASRDGDFDALVAVLDPDVELRIDGGVLREEAPLDSSRAR